MRAREIVQAIDGEVSRSMRQSDDPNEWPEFRTDYDDDLDFAEIVAPRWTLRVFGGRFLKVGFTLDAYYEGRIKQAVEPWQLDAFAAVNQRFAKGGKGPLLFGLRRSTSRAAQELADMIEQHAQPQTSNR